MSTVDQNFSTPSAGSSDWDSDLNGNFTIIARGYHKLATIGTDVITGDILTVSSDGYWRPMNPNSSSNRPHAIAYKSISSGEQDTVLLRGLVRSLGIASPAVPGEAMFVSPTTPGVLVGSYSGADKAVGYAVEEDGIYFDPGYNIFPETLTRSASVDAVTGSSHLISFDGGRGGYIRQIIMIGASADLVTLQLWTNSARDSRLFETVSGGVSVVGSYLDQAGLPYWNTDATTINGLIYGTLQVMSDAAVGSDTIGMSIVFERFR